MSLFQDVDNQIKEAMRSKAKDRLLALRNIKSHLKNMAIEAKRDLKDEEVHQALSTLAKQRRESIEAYQKAERQDLVEQESQELKVIQEFLPEPLSPEALEKLVAEAIKSTGASGPADMGKVMKALKEKTVGRADGKVLSGLVRDQLSA